jgi:type I restriction enzyme S subunit
MTDQNSTIPKDWKMTTLGEVADVQNGYAFKSDDFSDFGVPIIKIKNIASGQITLDGLDFFSGNVDLLNPFQIKKDDILVSMTGSHISQLSSAVGKVAKYNLKSISLLNQRVGKIYPKEKLSDNVYLWYLVSQTEVQFFWGNKAGGSANQANISPGIIKSYVFNMPSLLEQRAIAAVLSSLDDKIELLREQNNTLETTAQVIFKEWFVNFNFPGAVGKMVDSELGKIPEGWRVGTVDDVITRHTITYRCDADDLSKKGKTPIIDQGSNGLYGHTEREPDFEASAKNPVILFTNHTCNMWFINYPFCAIQNVIPFRGNDKYSSFFVYYMTLGQITFIEYKGHWPDFEQKEYVIPTPELADKFTETVKPLQYKIWNNNFQIQTLSDLRDTLLPKLMKGEIRVEAFRK